MNRSLLLLLSLAACNPPAAPGTEAAQKLDGEPKLDAPKVILKGPEDKPPAKVDAPPDASASTKIADGDGNEPPVVWESDFRVQDMVVDGTHMYVSRVGFPGGERGQIARVSLSGGKLEVIVDDLGRPDELALSNDEIFWIDRPAVPEDPPAGVRAAAKSGGEPRQVVQDARIEHGLTVANDQVYWVLRVTDQGKTGGFAGAPVSGGKPTDYHLDKGPVFHLRGDDGAIVFMAHTGSDPDVIFRTQPDGSDLKELHRAPRGIVALHVAPSHIYWGQAIFEPLSTSLMRIPKEGGKAETLWTLDGKLFDAVATKGERAWVSTSAVEDMGEVFWIPAAGGDATKVGESRHVWGVQNAVSEGRDVFWWDSHFADNTKKHRLRRPAP